MLTRYTDLADTKTLRKQRVDARLSPCSCGCRGRDYWHRTRYTRTVRAVEACEPRTRDSEGAIAIQKEYGMQVVYIVATGTARFPWANQPEPVVALRRQRSDGTWSPFVDWQLDAVHR